MSTLPMRRALLRLLAVTIAGVISLILSEVAVRLLWPQQLAGSWLTDSGHGYDVNRPGATASHTIGNRTAHYRINESGFRGGPLQNQRFRVLVLGDSATFGWLLEENDTYVEQLSKRAAQQFDNNVVFMNGAVGGWGGAEYVAYLEDLGNAILAPSSVLVFLSGDETRRTVESGLWALDDGNLRRLQKIRTNQSYRLLNRLPGYTLLIEHSHLANLARRAVFQGAATPPKPKPSTAPPQSELKAGVDLQNALMRRLAAWCAQRHIPLWVIATGYINFFGNEPQHDINRRFIGGAAMLFASVDAEYLDLTDDLAFTFNEPSKYFIPIDFHPNETGARLVADLSWPWLNERMRDLAK